MNQDQARRMAEEVELPALPEIPQDGKRGWRTDAQMEAYAREAIAAALVKYTQGQEAVAWMCEGWGPDCGPYREYRETVPDWKPEEWVALYTHPIPSQQEERVRELEKALDVAREDIVILSRLANSDHTGPRASISAINAALSKEQGK